MKRGRPLFYAVYTGICIYALLNFFFGASGVLAFQKLEEFKSEIDENLVLLENTYSGLAKELNLLTTSSEVIRLKSRELGYFEEDEIVIKVLGLNDKRSFHSVGRMINYPDGNTDRRPLFRLISFFAALGVFLLYFLVSRQKQ